ncbi:hypothetical protein CBL_04756 [Carabus blaptoides fortunei]
MAQGLMPILTIHDNYEVATGSWLQYQTTITTTIPGTCTTLHSPNGGASVIAISATNFSPLLDLLAKESYWTEISSTEHRILLGSGLPSNSAQSVIVASPINSSAISNAVCLAAVVRAFSFLFDHLAVRASIR